MTKPQIIKNLIELSGCGTIKEFAERHGYTRQRISEWQRGVRNISNSNLEAIAKLEGYKLTITLKLEKL